MADESLALLTANPDWAVVLEAYRVREAEFRAAAAETRRNEARLANAEPKTKVEVVADESAATESADEAGDTDSDSAGWCERLYDVAEIERTALSGIHGRLIAFGLLKCEVGHRSAGLVYRLSNQGKSALKGFQQAQSSPLAETA